MSNPLNQLQSLLSVRSQKNMSDMVYEKISMLIQNGDIPEGYVFPNEAVLCEQLAIGRSTIREAYKALELSGYVTRTKRGYHRQQLLHHIGSHPPKGGNPWGQRGRFSGIPANVGRPDCRLSCRAGYPR